MPSTPIVSTDLNKSVVDLDLNLKITTGSMLTLHDKEYPAIVTKVNTDTRTTKNMRYEGNGAAPAKDEGDNATTTTMIESFVEQTTQQTYAHDMPITWEARRFGIKAADIVNQMGEYQARSGVLRYEYTSASIINNGTSASYAGADTASYFSASHYWKSNPSATWSNLLAAAAMTATSIEADLIVIAGATIEHDIPAKLKASTVTIGTDNIFTLPEILKSTLDPETANNTYNAIRDVGLKKNLNNYLSDTNAYTIDSQKPSRWLVEGQSILLDSYMDKSNRNLIEQLFCSIAPYFRDSINSHHNIGT